MNLGICYLRALPEWQKWILYSRGNTICDAINNYCSFYIIRSDVLKEIIIAFRGTKTPKQLFMEGWKSLKPGNKFLNIGLVNQYFHQAHYTTWPSIEPLLKDPVFREYRVTFTGHSLGGALASLAATHTVITKLRSGDEIKLVTFGQPRTGDYDFAMFHNTNIPYSFRLVHRMDIVPHLPACRKNESYPSKNKPCIPVNDGFPYHHGTEIWYPNGMSQGSEYYECLGDPKGEDAKCSNSLTFDVSHYKVYIRDHRYYFNVKVPTYGKRGCMNMANVSSSDNDDLISLSVSPTFASGTESPFGQIRQGIANVARFLGSIVHRLI